uniref:Rab-GAP TBC domain-containing protein n=1 Tax=Brassica oleracea var. oleracea TaxID=109376 RepID=A0A0D3C7M4_BRAOL
MITTTKSEVEAMGFPKARATRALHYSGNASLEAAVNWMVEHENDPDVDEFPKESMKNILLVFAKLNQGIRYVQGMNEILAPIYYIFRSDTDEDADSSLFYFCYIFNYFDSHAEADAFFCFVELLSGFRDFYCQQLDNSVFGIRSAITRLSQLVRKHDEELWRHLEITHQSKISVLTTICYYSPTSILLVNPQFYAFRWITLLLTQEFSFFDSLHIWDALLSDPEGKLTGDVLCDAGTGEEEVDRWRFHI